MQAGIHHRSLANNLNVTLPRPVYSMAFPDDERESNPASFKFLEMAHKWARAAGASGGVGSSSPLQLPKHVHSETVKESAALAVDVRDGTADIDKEMEL